MNPHERTRSGLCRIVGYLVPLVQSVPVWTGLMTLPFAGYLLVLVANLPQSLPHAVSELFTPVPILEKGLIFAGLAMLVYSALYLLRHQRAGLLTSGPYGWVRHPQYLGMILSTLGFTSWSVWILTSTFGIGFLTPSQTIGVWLLELFAYVAIASIEEQELHRRFGQSFERYKRRVPFLIPFLKTPNERVNLLLSIVLPALVLCGLTVGSL